jgi:predicted MFS family arabinose efflux permease
VATNFQIETLGMTAADRGFMEGSREISGLLLVFISAATVAVAVPRLGMFALATLAIQYFCFSFVESIWQLIVLTAFGGIGLHMWMPLSRELGLSLADKSHSGRALGFIAGVTSAGALAGMVSVFVWAPVLGYRTMFLWSGVAVGAAALLVARTKSPRAAHEEVRKRFVFRREYSFYYVLAFLEGAARQIWFSFAMFTLVKNFGIDIRTVTAMLIANSLLTLFLNPRIGAWIDQWGERKSLMVGYGGLIVVFVGFSLSVEHWQAMTIYFAYSTMFAFSMAASSYLHKIARPGELSPSLAMGVTVEHVAGVGIPVIGGMIWVTYGYQFAFMVGAIVAAICFLTVTRLPRGKLVSAETAA